jgi:hypothetical protein
MHHFKKEIVKWIAQITMSRGKKKRPWRHNKALIITPAGPSERS